MKKKILKDFSINHSKIRIFFVSFLLEKKAIIFFAKVSLADILYRFEEFMLNRYYFLRKNTTFTGNKIIIIGRIILMENLGIIVVFG